MFTAELGNILIQVITSWQVLAVTAAVILYIALVLYVANLYHPPRRRLTLPKPKKPKSAPAATRAAEKEIITDDDDLGLEEEG
jgi:hypothetical protein